jgi:hypothetical protein
MDVIPTKSGEFEIIFRERYGNRPEPTVATRKQLTMRARMATALIEKWGMVAALPDGEDTSGRQKMRLMKPKEIVQHAIDVSKMAINAFEEEGWIDEFPSAMDEIEKPAE